MKNSELFFIYTKEVLFIKRIKQTITRKERRILAKSNRGKSLKKLPSRGRGTCPLCGKTRIKLLYTYVGEDGQKKVCKQCNKK